MTYTNDELMQLQVAAQNSIYERGNKYGQIGLPSSTGFYIPVSERGKRFISVTMEDSTIVIADSARVSPVPSAKVRLRLESKVWVIKGADEREPLASSSNSTVAVTKHNHNIGALPGLFYPVDPASVNDGMLLPTGNGLEVTVGRVTYPKSDGTIGIYDDSETLNFASAVTGLSASQARWSIVYVNKSDGTVSYYSATADDVPLDTASDLESAIAQCLNNVEYAYPYHAVRIGAGIATFGTYKGMAGRNMDSKDFVRIATVSASEVDLSAIKASEIATRFEPLMNGGISNPELLYMNGDVIMVEVLN